MHLAHLKLRAFRNYCRLDADFAPGFQLLLGNNAQGKTNILEAIYLLATLRSFRGVNANQMIQHKQKGCFIGAKLGGTMPRELSVAWADDRRQVKVDGETIRTLGDFLGCLRAVIFCNEDLQLIKGSARHRRRFVDLILTQIQPMYLPLLQRYTRTLRSRNALLKHAEIAPSLLESFSQELIKTGNAIIKERDQILPKISTLARLAYRGIAQDAEDLQINYLPNVKENFQAELHQSRDREQRYKATLVGPHRDEMGLMIDSKSAAQFGSEGQKRSIAISLKMAQAEFLTNIVHASPVLLIDDVMGELDAQRRSGLLPLLKRSHQSGGQVFMTCTEENWPRELGQHLKRWRVANGGLTLLD